VRDAALQICRAVKMQRQSTAGVANNDGTRSEFARQWLCSSILIHTYHEIREAVVRCRQADTSPMRFEPQLTSDTSRPANSRGLRVSRRCRFPMSRDVLRYQYT
jgi:hypothetical protein